jgi:hypothetical protein
VNWSMIHVLGNPCGGGSVSIAASYLTRGLNEHPESELAFLDVTSPHISLPMLVFSRPLIYFGLAVNESHAKPMPFECFAIEPFEVFIRPKSRTRVSA